MAYLLAPHQEPARHPLSPQAQTDTNRLSANDDHREAQPELAQEETPYVPPLSTIAISGKKAAIAGTTEGAVEAVAKVAKKTRNPANEVIAENETRSEDHTETHAEAQSETHAEIQTQARTEIEPQAWTPTEARTETNANAETLEAPPKDERMDADQALAPDGWLWLGAGMNYQYYQQSIPDFGNAKFQNITGPSQLLRGGFLANRFGLDLSYKNTPGKMSSSDSVSISHGEYSWKTISTDLLHRPSKESKWTHRLGLQHHSMPFMYRDPFNPAIDVKTNTLTMLTLGFDRAFPVSDKLRIEWQMRYQHPVMTGTTNGASFSVSQRMALDGSVGGVFSAGERTRLGVYWYGQWHQYRFNYNIPGQLPLAGEQTLFYSNIEIRVGLEF